MPPLTHGDAPATKNMDRPVRFIPLTVVIIRCTIALVLHHIYIVVPYRDSQDLETAYASNVDGARGQFPG